MVGIPVIPPAAPPRVGMVGPPGAAGGINPEGMFGVAGIGGGTEGVCVPGRFAEPMDWNAGMFGRAGGAGI